MIQQVFGHFRLHTLVARDIQNLIAEIPGVRGTDFSLGLDVPFLQQVG